MCLDQTLIFHLLINRKKQHYPIFPFPIFSDHQEVIYRTQSEPRDPRSFKSFIQSTSKGAIQLAQKAMQSFFPNLANTKNNDLIEDQLNGLRMNRRSVNEGDKTQTNMYQNYLPYQMAATPYAQYYGGYQQYPYYASNYYQSQNQPDLSKRISIALKEPGSKQTSGTPNPNTNTKEINKKSEQASTSVDRNQSILQEIENDTHGFYDAIDNTKEALITKLKTGGLSIIESLEGNTDKPGIGAKKNEIKGKKKKNKKTYEEDYKRALLSQGDLEQKLVSYFTDYICGDDC